MVKIASCFSSTDTKSVEWNETKQSISLINDITQLCWSWIQFFFIEVLLCKFLLHYESWILLLGSQHGFQKVDKPKGYFFLLEIIKGESTACSHSLNCTHAKVLLSSTYTEAGATGLNLPSDLSPVIQTTAAKTWGQLFLLCCFPLYLSLQATIMKRGIVLISHAGKASFLPSNEGLIQTFFFFLFFFLIFRSVVVSNIYYHCCHSQRSQIRQLNYVCPVCSSCVILGTHVEWSS